jgi:hypothetical protein
LKHEKETHMKTYEIFNEHDPNDRFQVEAETLEDAYREALSALGWLLCEADQEDNAA